jgi:hypothetical protein
MKDFGFLVVKTYGPSQDAPDSNKYIMLVSLFFGLYFLFQFFSSFGLLIFMFEEGKWDLFMAGYYLYIFFILIAGLLFWKREKLGWMLAAIYSIFTLAVTIPLFISELRFKETGGPVLDSLMPRSSRTEDITSIILFSGLIWILFKPGIRKIYGIGATTMLVCSGLGVILFTYVFFTWVIG